MSGLSGGSDATITLPEVSCGLSSLSGEADLYARAVRGSTDGTPSTTHDGAVLQSAPLPASAAASPAIGNATPTSIHAVTPIVDAKSVLPALNAASAMTLKEEASAQLSSEIPSVTVHPQLPAAPLVKKESSHSKRSRVVRDGVSNAALHMLTSSSSEDDDDARDETYSPSSNRRAVSAASAASVGFSSAASMSHLHSSSASPASPGTPASAMRLSLQYAGGVGPYGAPRGVVESPPSPDSLIDFDDKCGGGSCHQCKTARPRSQLMICTRMGDRCRKRRCRKKFCHACLLRSYGLAANTLTAEELHSWLCPACQNTCICAACARRQQGNKPGASSGTGAASQGANSKAKSALQQMNLGVGLPFMPPLPMLSLSSPSLGPPAMGQPWPSGLMLPGAGSAMPRSVSAHVSSSMPGGGAGSTGGNGSGTQSPTSLNFSPMPSPFFPPNGTPSMGWSMPHPPPPQMGGMMSGGYSFAPPMSNNLMAQPLPPADQYGGRSTSSNSLAQAHEQQGAAQQLAQQQPGGVLMSPYGLMPPVPNGMPLPGQLPMQPSFGRGDSSRLHSAPAGLHSSGPFHHPPMPPPHFSQQAMAYASAMMHEPQHQQQYAPPPQPQPYPQPFAPQEQQSVARSPMATSHAVAPSPKLQPLDELPPSKAQKLAHGSTASGANTEAAPAPLTQQQPAPPTSTGVPSGTPALPPAPFATSAPTPALIPAPASAQAPAAPPAASPAAPTLPAQSPAPAQSSQSTDGAANDAADALTFLAAAATSSAPPSMPPPAQAPPHVSPFQTQPMTHMPHSHYYPHPPHHTPYLYDQQQPPPPQGYYPMSSMSQPYYSHPPPPVWSSPLMPMPHPSGPAPPASSTLHPSATKSSAPMTIGAFRPRPPAASPFQPIPATLQPSNLQSTLTSQQQPSLQQQQQQQQPQQ